MWVIQKAYINGVKAHVLGLGTEYCEGTNTAKAIWKKNKSSRLTVLSVKVYFKAIVIKAM